MSICERRPQVVALELEAPDPRAPLGSTKRFVRGVRQPREVLRVSSPGSLEAVAFGKATERVLLHRVEQVVAGLGARERDGDDGLVDERAEQLDHRHLVEPVLGTRSDEGVESRTASMHRKWWSRVFSSAWRRS